MLLLLLLSFTFTYVNGEECFPCRCEGETIDCTGADVIPSYVLNNMYMFERIIMPSHLIDGNLLQQGLLLEPTDTGECVYICSIPGVKSTCTCKVSCCCFLFNLMSIFLD